MTRYACNFVPVYKSYIETKHKNRDRLGLSEMGLASYTWVQNYTPIESFFNKILNVKHG